VGKPGFFYQLLRITARICEKTRASCDLNAKRDGLYHNENLNRRTAKSSKKSYPLETILNMLYIINIMKLSKNEIKKHIANHDWQKTRLLMKSKTLEEKKIMLTNWLHVNNFDHASKVQTQNYINALKRGGLIKKENVFIRNI